MTRKEKLEKAATKYAQDKYLPVQTAQSFKAGAKWADEHPKEGLVDIDKALAFLHGIRLDYYIEHNDELVNDFRKAMEE